MTRRRLSLAAVVVGVAVCAASVAAQTTPAPQPPGPFETLAPAVAAAAGGAQIDGSPVTLVYTNRPVVVFRATIAGRPPSVRAASAIELLNGLVVDRPQGAVSTHAFDGAVLVAIGDRPVFVVFAADLDPLAGETLADTSADAAARLDRAFREAVEFRSPGRLLQGAGFALGATVLYALAMWLLIRFDRRLATAAGHATERRLRAMRVGELMVHVRAPMLVRRLLWFVGVAIGALVTYSWLTAVLRRFPYTRPWGESLREALFGAALAAARQVLDELPNLLTILAIVLLTRFLVRLVTVAFEFVEQERVTLPGVHPETAQPTRRIVVALLWLFALVVSYEYLPGSESDVFKGMSVFVGLVVSLGSTGIMNQVMSGLMVTYSRAVRVGDFVRIGETEGTVTHLGTLSTKVRTPRNEEITIPNAVIVAQATTNFSRHAVHDGVFVSTVVSIGYDTPWRQVHALLLLAVDRSAGIRREPAPVVLQSVLGDFAVQYTLLVCLEDQAKRLSTLAALHSNIQDAFNEYGVQIMSPNYEADPAGRKTVPLSHWYAAPAVAPAGTETAGRADPVSRAEQA